jgi:hypothetical protein
VDGFEKTLCIARSLSRKRYYVKKPGSLQGSAHPLLQAARGAKCNGLPVAGLWVWNEVAQHHGFDGHARVDVLVDCCVIQ